MTALKRVFVEGFGWAMVDSVGNIWDFADAPEDDNEYDEAERQSEWEFEYGYCFDDDRH